MESMKFDYNKHQITITVITLSGFYCFKTNFIDFLSKTFSYRRTTLQVSRHRLRTRFHPGKVGLLENLCNRFLLNQFI